MTDEHFWRRPSTDSPSMPRPPEPVSPGRMTAPGDGTGAGYAGPPQTVPASPTWRPEVVVEPSPPRPLPTQDHAAIDAQERSARTVTYGVGLVAGAILLLLICVLCGRLVF